MRGPQPWAPELGISRFERGVVPVGKAPGNRPRAGLGFRVYKPKVSRVNRERLKTLYNDVVNYVFGVVRELKGSKYLAYYAEEWKEMHEEAKRMREEAGKRTLPKTPPVLVPVRFVMPDGSTRGDNNAPAVVDLRRGELRIPSYGIAQRLRKSLVRALVEENNLNPRPDFVLQVTRRGLLHLVASRYVPARVALPLRIIAIDENSLNGEALAAWDVLKPGRIVRSRYEELMPRNRGFLDRTAALFQSAADGNPEALEEVVKMLHESGKGETEIAPLLTPEKLAEIAAETREKEKRLNRAFAEELVSLVRKLVREAKARGGAYGGGEAPSNRAGLGFRVYKPKVSRVNREKLKVLYNDIVNYLLGITSELKGSKYLAYYADEWKKMYEEVKEMRREAGKRTLPKTPPVLIPVRFVMPDGTMRGDKNAPCVIDLKKRELRIPSYGIVQRLRRSLVRALIEENSLEPRPDFVLQVTRRGFLRLIASRYAPARVALPLRIIAIDENSLNGEALAAWDVLKPGRIVRSRYEEVMPRNRGFLDRTAALFQSAAAGKAGALEKVKELLREAGKDGTEIAALLAPEKLAEIAAETLEKEKRLTGRSRRSWCRWCGG